MNLIIGHRQCRSTGSQASDRPAYPSPSRLLLPTPIVELAPEKRRRDQQYPSQKVTHILTSTPLTRLPFRDSIGTAQPGLCYLAGEEPLRCSPPGAGSFTAIASRRTLVLAAQAVGVGLLVVAHRATAPGRTALPLALLFVLLLLLDLLLGLATLLVALLD